MLRSKNLMKVASLLIAIVLWAYVMAIENPPTTQKIPNIPVTLQNAASLAQNGLAILEGENRTVDVTVQGTRTDILKYKNQITANANVFGYNVGENYIGVDVNLPNGLTRVDVNPAKILVKIDSLVSVYKPVELSFTGDMAPGTESGSITVRPEQIEVKGPKSLVESVSYVGVSIPYSQISRAGSTFTLNAAAIDMNDEVVQNVTLSSNTVNVTATLYDTKTVPLSVNIIGQLSEKYEMTNLDAPDTIKIKGAKGVLAGIDSVAAEPIDISGVENTSELPIKPILPAGVEVADGSRGIHVNIDIKGISICDFDYSSQEIEIIGLGEGLSAYINTPSVHLHAAGEETTLDNTVKEDFKLSVDLTGMDLGAQIVTVTVTHDKAVNSLVLDPPEVHITINRDLVRL